MIWGLCGESGGPSTYTYNAYHPHSNPNFLFLATFQRSGEAWRKRLAGAFAQSSGLWDLLGRVAGKSPGEPKNPKPLNRKRRGESSSFDGFWFGRDGQGLALKGFSIAVSCILKR